MFQFNAMGFMGVVAVAMCWALAVVLYRVGATGIRREDGKWLTKLLTMREEFLMFLLGLYAGRRQLFERVTENE
jgi:hypothetical protein